MYNFTLQIPTRIHFGKDTISYLSELKEYGDNPNIPTIHRGFSDYVQTAFFTKSEETGKMGADYIFDILNQIKFRVIFALIKLSVHTVY